MSDLLSLPPAPCPECGNLRAALEQARQQIAQLQAEIRELRSQLQRNSSNSSSPPSLDPPGPPSPSSRPPPDASPAANRGTPDIIATDCPSHASRTSCRSCPLSPPTARPPCPTTPPPATPNRPGIRSPRFPCSRRSSPSIKGRRTPARAVATPRGLRFPRRSATIVGPDLAAILSSFSGRHPLGSGASRSWSRPSSKCRSPWGWSRRWKAR